MKTLVMNITLNDGYDSQELYDLLTDADCVADYEFMEEFGDEPENEFNKFVEQFKPIKNHFDENVAYDGCLFETYGDELEFVKAQPANTIWTVVDCDGKSVIMSGFHVVNRLGYFVTKRARKQDDGDITYNV